MSSPSRDANGETEEDRYERELYEQQCREESERYMQVTREMARDAGDLSLEGQWIQW